MPPTTVQRPRLAVEALRVLLAIAAVKILFLVLDPTPRFFLWDSVTYLNGGLFGDLPRDRSMLYGWLIGSIAVPAHSLHALVIAQTVAGIASAFLVFFNLRVLLGTRFWLACAACLLFAAEPSQLWYERMLMAEAFGSLAWLGFTTLVAVYCLTGRAIWLPAVTAAGILAVSFRLNPTLTAVAVGGLLPLWRAAFVRDGASAPGLFPPRNLKPLFAHLALALASTAALHVGYQQMVGRLLHTPPGYIGVEGLFHMGFVAPLIGPEHFEGTGCPPDILQRFTRPLHDPRNREAQLWSDDGLWAAMRKACPEPEHAAAIVAERTLHAHPIAMLAMGFPTAAQYFDEGESIWRMESDLGHKGMMPLELIDPVRKYFFFDAGPIPYLETVSSQLFKHSRYWLTFCFFALPLLAWAVMVGSAHDARDAPRRALVLIAFWLFASQLLFSHVICFRYLHPFPPMVLMLIATLLDRRPWRKDRGTVAT